MSTVEAAEVHPRLLRHLEKRRPKAAFSIHNVDLSPLRNAVQ